MMLQNLNSSHECYKIRMNTPSFFKIIIDTSANHLAIPHLFVKEEIKSCWSEAAATTTTTTRETRWAKVVIGSGKSWNVKIKEVDGVHYFADGWAGFAEDNNVEFGDFLVFWLVHHHRHSIFTFFASIYAPHGCPKDPVSPPTNNNACARSGDQGVKHQTLGLGHSKHQNVQMETRTRTMIKIEYEEVLPRTIYMQQNGKGSNEQDNLKKQSGKKRGRPPLKDSMPLMRGRGRLPLKKKKTEMKPLPKKSYWREDREGETKEEGLMTQPGRSIRRKSSDEESTPAKRGRGRPLGSKRKPKMKVIHEEAALAMKLGLECGEGETKEVLMTQPGKPRGQRSSDEELRPAKRTRGKPSGSINKLEMIVVHEEAALDEKLPLESERDKSKEKDLMTQPGRPGQRSSDEESTPAKRGSGRPPGREIKPKMKANPEEAVLAKKIKLESGEGESEEGLITQPGRPRGQKSSDEESTPAKRGSGRPPGREIKPKMKANHEEAILAKKIKLESGEGESEEGLMTQPGRPRGRRSSDEESTAAERGSGSPPGSKNKMKMEVNNEGAALAKKLGSKRGKRGKERQKATYHLRSNSYLRSHPNLRSHARCSK